MYLCYFYVKHEKKICLRSCNELKETFQRRNKEAFLEYLILLADSHYVFVRIKEAEEITCLVTIKGQFRCTNKSKLTKIEQDFNEIVRRVARPIVPMSFDESS